MDWKVIVADLGPRLYRYFAVSFPAFSAADLVQECLLRLLRKVEEGKYDSSRGNIRMLAFGIAHYVRLEALKSRRTERLDERMPSGAEDVETVLIEHERRARLRRAIGDLNEGERQVVLLYLDRELTMEEIGRILGLPVGTVKSHLHRAKDRLKQALQEPEGEHHG